MTFDSYIKSINLEFNEQQLAAIKRIDGATLILAVPGSGKTTAIIARIGYMVRVLRINPQSILTITYTRAATVSMRTRYEQLFGSSDGVEFRTIHGICAKILAHFERVTGKHVFSLISKEGEMYGILRAVFSRITGNIATEAELKELSTRLTYHRNMLSKSEEILSENLTYINFKEFYDAYKAYKLENKLMDHDDQLEYAYTILRSTPEILEYFQERYKYINVDEAQDTSKLQHEIIRLLVHQNIFMVGDEDQSIYGFRAAYPEALLNFTKIYEGGKVLLMETNYRSSQSIVSFANDFIKRNANRYEKNMLSVKGVGTKPQLIKLYDFSSICPYLVSLAKKSDIETAILYRNNENALPLIDAFNKNGVKFRIQGGDASFFTSRTVKSLISMLEFVMNPHDEKLFMQVYYLFKIGMSRDNANEAVALHRKNSKYNIIEIAAEHELTQYRFRSRLSLLPNQIKECSKMRTADALRFCAYDLMHKHTFFVCDASDCHKLQVLLSIAESYSRISEFVARIVELELEVKTHENPKHGCITLSTIHSAKGLEYDRVILTDVKAGTLPILTAEKVITEADKKVYEEDRRLLYVAVTRAKRELLIFTSERENMIASTRSPFIDECFFPTSAHIKRIKNDTVRASVSKTKPTQQKKQTQPKEIQLQIRAGLISGAIIEHCTFGRCAIIELNSTVMRIRVFADKSIKPIHIETAIKRGLIKLTGEHV